LPGQILTKQVIRKILSLFAKHFALRKKNLVLEVFRIYDVFIHFQEFIVIRSIIENTESRKLLLFPQLLWVLLTFLKIEDYDYFVKSFSILLFFQGTIFHLPMN
jgi:hypothetical protein